MWPNLMSNLLRRVLIMIQAWLVCGVIVFSSLNIVIVFSSSQTSCLPNIYIISYRYGRPRAATPADSHRLWHYRACSQKCTIVEVICTMYMPSCLEISHRCTNSIFLTPVCYRNQYCGCVTLVRTCDSFVRLTLWRISNRLIKIIISRINATFVIKQREH